MITHSEARAILRKNLSLYRRNPVEFVRREFNAEPDTFQQEALMAFADPEKRRIAMKACKGPGKTTTLAWCIWNFMLCYGEPGDHPKGAATSITGDNLRDNLWAELAKWRERSKLLQHFFDAHSTRIYARDHPETWFFSARTWGKSSDAEQQANTLAGLHAKYLLFVLDESGGIPLSVMAAADAGLSTEAPGHFIKVLQAGNPTHLEGPLYNACTIERSMWYLIQITGDPDSPKRSERISVRWAREQIEKYGRDNPWVLVNVFGEFPPASMNALLGPDEVAAAMSRHATEDKYNWAARILGVDVARFGDSQTVIFPRQGIVSFKPVVMRHANTQEIAGRIARAWEIWHPDAIFIDDTGGWASGVIDNLNTAHIPNIPINASGKAMNPRYFNKRSEMAFDAADWVKKGGILPPEPMLQREATAFTYWFHEGKMRLEEKDQVKTKLNGHSPDYWDSFCLTHAQPVAASKVPHHIKTLLTDQDDANRDWDPFDPKRL